jgi:hypothetical protein
MTKHLYSERLRQQKTAPDVFEYEEFGNSLRVKIQYAIKDLLGTRSDYLDDYGPAPKAYMIVVERLRREYGRLRLSGSEHASDNRFDDLMNFIASDDVQYVLVAMVGRISTEHGQDLDVDRYEATINKEFRRHAVGYQLHDGAAFRVDNTYSHAEVTKPALALLSDERWRGAEDEFLKAHEHYRHGRNKEALNEAAKSLESVMKAICSARKWTVAPNAATKDLIAVCLQNGLIPSYWQNQMAGLRTLLESGVATARNKQSGHGQGVTPVEVPDHIAGYVLHMAAAAIVFLVNADAALSR